VRRQRGLARGAIDSRLDPGRFASDNPGALELAGELVRLLLTMNIQVGERIASERTLSERLGMSRSSVREAIKALALLGVVEVRRGSGTYLARPDSDMLPQVIDWGLLLNDNSLFEILDLRQMLEPQIAREAATLRSEQDLDELRALLIQMEEGSELQDRLAADIDFHRRLAAILGNQAITTVANNTLNLVWAWVRRLSLISEHLGSPNMPVPEHAAILDAISAGDPDAAEEAMRVHLARTAVAIKQVAAFNQRVSLHDN